MPSKLRKKGTAGKLVGGALKVASNFVPGGGLIKGAVGLAGKLAGGMGGRGASGKKTRRRSAMYYLKKIPVEKAKAKLIKIKMSAYKGL